MRRFIVLISAFLAFFATPVAAQEVERLTAEASAFLNSLTPRSGEVVISKADVKLHLGEKYLFYSASDAQRILIEAWGNPPDMQDDVLGLIMPAGTTPFSDAWGAVVTYEDTGYVADDDAASTDFDDLLETLQEGAEQESELRREAGYPGVEVIGWAQRPRYDRVGHSVVWAKEIAFDNEEVHVLNYDLRTLGRRGVLSLNLLSSMPDLPEIRVAANELASTAQFNPGARYEDFNDETDERAGYGIAGLVAGGAGLAAAKKFGLLAILAKFAKPILIGIAVLFGGLFKPIMRLFGRKEDEVDDWQNYEEHHEAQGEPDERAPLPDDRPIS